MLRNRSQGVLLLKRRTRAFTLIELLVVIAIIIILVFITVPAVKAMTKSNNQKQAVNLITSMLATARAVAIERHAAAGVVLYEESNMYIAASAVSRASGQTYAQLIYAISSTSSSVSGTFQVDFKPLPQTIPQALPKGIVVACLDDTT